MGGMGGMGDPNLTCAVTPAHAGIHDEPVENPSLRVCRLPILRMPLKLHIFEYHFSAIVQ